MRPASSRAILTAAEQPALLVSHPVNLRYLTGVEVSTGLLLILPRRSILFVDGRYIEAAKRDANRTITVADVGEVERALARVSVCAIEAEHVTVARLQRWRRKFSSTKFVATSGVIEEFRRTKDDDELRIMNRANRITEEMLRRIPSQLRSVTTERGLATKLRIWADEIGADGLAFEPIVAFGTHTSSPHHVPTSRALKKGAIVQIDVGAKYRGYHADRSAVFFTAKPTPVQQNVLNAVRAAVDRTRPKVKAGASAAELDTFARAVLTEHGFSDKDFTHALGHGVGLEIHEGVTLSGRAGHETLRAREVVTLEPGLYFPGKFGMRIEEMVVVR
jgi:Xaa-Pro aminopeptidase/Xaa-Pro dipeptidase